MTLSPTRRSSLKAIADGGLNALDIEIDNLGLNPHLKGFLHNVIEGADKTLTNLLTDKKILERAEATQGVKYTAPKSDEPVEQPATSETRALPDRSSRVPVSVFDI